MRSFRPSKLPVANCLPPIVSIQPKRLRNLVLTDFSSKWEGQCNRLHFVWQMLPKTACAKLPATKKESRMTSIRKVSQVAGVSVAIVSRTMSHPDQDRTEAREKVFEAIKAVGYRLSA
jgi:hypothetical protein